MSIRCEVSRSAGPMRHQKPIPRRTLRHRLAAAATVMAFTCSSVTPAMAYNFNTHQAMVDLAYQIMRAAIHPDPTWRLGPRPSSTGGGHVPPDWPEFVPTQWWSRGPGAPCMDDARLLDLTSIDTLRYVDARYREWSRERARRHHSNLAQAKVLNPAPVVGER